MKPETIRRLLAVLVSFGEPCTAEQFARAAYGDSSAWKRSRKIVAAAAGVLGRLRALRLVERSSGRYRVSASGSAYLGGDALKHALKQAENPPKQPVKRAPGATPGWVVHPLAPGGFVWFDGQWGWWWPDGFGGLVPWLALARS